MPNCVLPNVPEARIGLWSQYLTSESEGRTLTHISLPPEFREEMVQFITRLTQTTAEVRSLEPRLARAHAERKRRAAVLEQVMRDFLTAFARRAKRVERGAVLTQIFAHKRSLLERAKSKYRILLELGSDLVASEARALAEGFAAIRPIPLILHPALFFSVESRILITPVGATSKSHPTRIFHLIVWRTSYIMVEINLIFGFLNSGGFMKQSFSLFLIVALFGFGTVLATECETCEWGVNGVPFCEDWDVTEPSPNSSCLVRVIAGELECVERFEDCPDDVPWWIRILYGSN